MPLIRKPGGSGASPVAPASASEFTRLLSGTDDERWAAARAAPELPNAVEPLADALVHEKNARVREAIFTALARIGTQQSVEAVLPFLRSDDARVRTEAADALGAMKSVMWPYLADLLRDGDSDIRILACELVRTMPGEEATRLFVGMLDAEPEANVCAAAVEVLADLGGPEALPALERCKARFQATPFLLFSIQTAADRIRAQWSSPRA